MPVVNRRPIPAVDGDDRSLILDDPPPSPQPVLTTVFSTICVLALVSWCVEQLTVADGAADYEICIDVYS